MYCRIILVQHNTLELYKVISTKMLYTNEDKNGKIIMQM